MIERQLAEGPGNWVTAAACVGQHHLFLLGQTASHRHPTHRRQRTQINQAKHICGTCGVVAQCRAWAMAEPDPAYDHIAGGLTPRERHEMKAKTRRDH